MTIASLETEVAAMPRNPNILPSPLAPPVGMAPAIILPSPPTGLARDGATNLEDTTRDPQKKKTTTTTTTTSFEKNEDLVDEKARLKLYKIFRDNPPTRLQMQAAAINGEMLVLKETTSLAAAKEKENRALQGMIGNLKEAILTLETSNTKLKVQNLFLMVTLRLLQQEGTDSKLAKNVLGIALDGKLIKDSEWADIEKKWAPDKEEQAEDGEKNAEREENAEREKNAERERKENGSTPDEEAVKLE